MFKQSIFAALILCLPAVVLTGCDKDEPAVVTPETPVTPDNPDDKDNPDKDGDENPGSSDNPGDKGEKKVVINTDGTTSDGSHFRRIDETIFMLNYVKYKIRDGHIEVTGYDSSEIELTLKGKVDLYSTIEIDNVSYNVRKIGRHAFNGCSSLKEINIPNSINEQVLKAYESSSWSSDSREYKTKIIGVDTETFDFKEYLKNQGVYE